MLACREVPLKHALALIIAVVTASACAPKEAPAPEAAGTGLTAELAPRVEVVEEKFGQSVADPFRNLESEEVAAPWVDGQHARFLAYTDDLPQRQALYDRFQALWRYDDATVRTPCRLGEREVWATKQADQDKWVYHLAMGPGDAQGKVIVDPNTWEQVEQLAELSYSPDCRYAVVGKSRAGDENAVLRVLDLDSLEYLPDTMRGWKQRGVSWKHDNSGFYYQANPLEGEREGEGAHHYFWTAWYHTLGTPAESDEVVLSSSDDRNLFHNAWVSEDGRWELRQQSQFNKNRLWIRALEGKRRREPRVVIDELEGNVNGEIVDGKLLLHTDIGAERWRLMVADVAEPGREHWRELIPEREDKLESVTPANGVLYARYSHDVTTRIVMFDLEGNELGEVALPTLGTAWVWGRWGHDEVRITFVSFGQPRTIYNHDRQANSLEVLKLPAMPVEQELLERIVVDQVWYTSRDGTRVPMFVVHQAGAEMGGPIPTLMSGYGGFDVSNPPRFSTTALAWVERGGAYVVTNLRGGGEFGKAWHEAGMREKKQNVFDDFLGAADWLIAEGWTTPEQLAIAGGSNGGLLVAAAITQAPEKFAAVLCQVPLTDMLRFHTFGLADIWTEEYGSPDDEEMFPHLLAYSPYHQVRAGTDYPAVLVVGSANDARVDPVHAIKFTAALQHADVDHGTVQPILLEIQRESGHGGGVGIDVRADQVARNHAFLMSAVGLGAGE